MADSDQSVFGAREQLAFIRRHGGNSATIKKFHAFQAQWSTFTLNVMEARESGYEAVCVECGVGLADDGNEAHERGCGHAA